MDSLVAEQVRRQAFNVNIILWTSQVYLMELESYQQVR